MLLVLLNTILRICSCITLLLLHCYFKSTLFFKNYKFCTNDIKALTVSVHYLHSFSHFFNCFYFYDGGRVLRELGRYPGYVTRYLISAIDILLFKTVLYDKNGCSGKLNGSLNKYLSCKYELLNTYLLPTHFFGI